jgi:hypothetical protein
MSNSNPNIPIVNLGNLYIQALSLVWKSTTAIILNSGQARDASDVNDIVLSSAVNISISSNGANGLDTGTIAASSLYYVYLIGSSNNLAASAGLLSLSASAPLLPYNYDMFRRVGAIAIDSGSHVRPFVQSGRGQNRTMWYDPGTGASTAGVVIPSSGTSGSTTFVNLGVLTSLVPQLPIECIINCAFTPNSAGNVLYLAPATIDNGTTACVGSMAELSAEVTGHAQIAALRVPCALPNATQQSGLTIGNVVTILYASTSGSDSVVFLLNGYIDQL